MQKILLLRYLIAVPVFSLACSVNTVASSAAPLPKNNQIPTQKVTINKKLDLDLHPRLTNPHPSENLLSRKKRLFFIKPDNRKKNDQKDVRPRLSLEFPTHESRCKYPTASCQLRKMYIQDPKQKFDLKNFEKTPQLRLEFKD